MIDFKDLFCFRQHSSRIPSSTFIVSLDQLNKRLPLNSAASTPAGRGYRGGSSTAVQA